MKRTLLTILAVLCACTVTLGVGAACSSNEGTTTSSSAQLETLKITGRPEGDTITLTDTVKTLVLGCDEKGVKWTSSDTAVATVEDGTVTLHAAGSTVISVTKGDKTGTFILTVIDGRAAKAVEVTSVPVQLSVGSFHLAAPAIEGEVEWLSRNEKVATVDETGKVTLLRRGNVEIVAQKKGDVTVFCIYKVQISDGTTSSVDVIKEDFSSAVVIGNYVVGEIECRDASNALSPEIIYDEIEDNYYLKYSHAKADGNNKYMIYSFSGLEAGARYVLKYNMKVLSKEGTYNHQINLYSDKEVPVIANNPLVGNVYNWHTTGLDTDDAKIYQSGSGALYRDGVRWKDSDDSMDAFHEYTFGFIAGESSVGFAFVCNNTYEVLFDYVCVEKAPVVDEYALTSTARLPVGESYPLTPVATEDVIYYQPFKLTYESSDSSIATVDEKGVVTALKEGEVTITATNVNGGKKTTVITVIPAVDGEAYDLFYEETDELAEDTRLYKEYALQETLAANAVQGDSYKITLEIDAIYYVGNVQLYLGLVNPTGTLIGQRFWTSEEFPASGEKKTLTFNVELPWASGNFDLSKLQIYIRYGTEYQIGVNVLSIEWMENPLAANYDLWYVGRSAAVEKTFTLAEPVTGGIRYDEVEVTLSLDLLDGTMPRIKFYLLNTKGEQITDPADYGWITVADYYDETTNTYKFKTSFPWTTGNWNVGAVWLLVEDGSHKLGVDVESVKCLGNPLAENYDLLYIGGKAAVEKTFDLEVPVTGGVRYDEVEVTLSLDLLEGTMPRIKFYLLNTDGAQITNPADYGWITVADYYDETTNTYKFKTSFPWTTGNWDVGALWLLVEDGAYLLGVDVESVEIEKANEYDFTLQEVRELTHTLPKMVTGAIRYDTAEITLELVELFGDLTKIKIELLNASGATIANNGNQYYTLADCATSVANTYTFTTTFPWASGDWEISAIKLGVDSTEYIVGVNVKSIEIKETAYQLEYAFSNNSSQAQTYAFDKVEGGQQNGYVKVTFDVAVFYGTLTNIQFNLCTDTEGATTVANSNKAWAEDGTKITSSGGQISMDNCNAKKTVTIVTTFPWANGNWDLQSIRLQLYGTNLQAGVSNIQVELLSDFEPTA